MKYLHEAGDYWLIVHGNVSSGYMCDMVITNSPPHHLLSLALALGTIFLALGLWGIVKEMYTKYGSSLKASVFIPHKPPPIMEELSCNNLEMLDRLSSLDAQSQKSTKSLINKKEVDMHSADFVISLRGVYLLIVLFNMSGGDGYVFLSRSPWNGIALADITLPGLLFTTGTIMAVLFRNMTSEDVQRKHILLGAFQKCFKFIFIGFILDSKDNSDMLELRFCGILQRIALVYVIVASIHCTCAREAEIYKDTRFAMFADIVDYWPEWAAMLTIMALHTIYTFAMPVPGCPQGYLGAGGWADGGANFNCTGGAAGYIDRLLMTTKHIGQGTYESVYGQSRQIDSEGLLATLPASLTCFLGLQAGKIMNAYPSHSSRITRWLIWSIVLGGLGALLCNLSLNDGWIPLNRNIWSLSFTFVMASSTFMMLIIFYMLMNIKPLWTGVPFFYSGKYIIPLYALNIIFHDYFPFQLKIGSTRGIDEMRLWGPLWVTSIWAVLAYVLYEKGIVIDV